MENIELDETLKIQNVSGGIIEYKLTEGVIHQVVARTNLDGVLLVDGEPDNNQQPEVWIKWKDEKKPELKVRYDAAVGQRVVMISVNDGGKYAKENNLWLLNRDTGEKSFVYFDDSKRMRAFPANSRGTAVKVKEVPGQKMDATINSLAKRLHSMTPMVAILMLCCVVGFPVLFLMDKKISWLAGISSGLAIGVICALIIERVTSVPGEMKNLFALLSHSEKIKASMLKAN